MKKVTLRILVFFAALSALIATFPIAAASKTAVFSAQTMEYDTVGKRYVNATDFSLGDTVIFAVKVSGIQGIQSEYVRGNTIRISYDSSVLNFQKDGSFTTVVDDNAVFLTEANNGSVVVVWDTSSQNVVFNDIVYYIKFTVSESLTQDVVASFGLTVDELYSKSFSDIPFSVQTPSISANITVKSVSDDVIALFNLLENIDENSLDDIRVAMNAYDGLTALQKAYVYNSCPQQYEWLSTAYSRYYAAVENISNQKVLAMVNDFNQKYGDILAKDINSVTSDDIETIKNLNTTYNALPTSVTSRLEKGTADKIKALVAKVEEINDAVVEVDDFNSAYSEVMALPDSSFNSLYDHYAATVDEAIMVYDSLSDSAKSQLKSEYDRLVHIQSIINELLENDEEQQKIREKVNAFQKKWLRVFTLTSSNVSVSDKTAIEMAIADFSTQDEDVKNFLSAKMTSLNSLLTVIKDLEETGQSTGEIQVITQPGETVTVTNTVTKTVVEKVPADAAETITKTVVKKGFTRSIYVLLAFLIFAMLLMIFPAVLQLRYNKLANIADGGDFESASSENTESFTEQRGDNDEGN